MVILHLCGTQIYQAFDDGYFALSACVLKFNRSGNARYAEIAHQYCRDTQSTNYNSSCCFHYRLNFNIFSKFAAKVQKNLHICKKIRNFVPFFRI